MYTCILRMSSITAWSSYKRDMSFAFSWDWNNTILQAIFMKSTVDSDEFRVLHIMTLSTHNKSIERERLVDWWLMDRLSWRRQLERSRFSRLGGTSINCKCEKQREKSKARVIDTACVQLVPPSLPSLRLNLLSLFYPFLAPSSSLAFCQHRKCNVW